MTAKRAAANALAAACAIGLLAGASPVGAGATEIRDEALQYVFHLDGAFEPIEDSALPGLHHAHVTRAGTPQAITVGIVHLGTVIPDDPPSASSLPPHTKCGPGEWMGHTVYLCESRPGNEAFTLEAALPLAPEAVVVAVSGRAGQEFAIRDTLRRILTSFGGEWAPVRPQGMSATQIAWRLERIGQAIGSAVGWIIFLALLLRRKYGWGRAVGIATLSWLFVASAVLALVRTLSPPAPPLAWAGKARGSPAGTVPSFAPAFVAPASSAPSFVLSADEAKALDTLDAKVADVRKSLSRITSATSPNALEKAIKDVESQCATLSGEVTKAKAHLTPRGTKIAGDAHDVCGYQPAIAALRTSTALLPKHSGAKKALCLGATKALAKLHDLGRDNDADVATEVEKLGKLCM